MLVELRGRAVLSLPLRPVRARNDPQEDIVGMAAVRVGVRGHVQAVEMQVGGVRAMQAVDVAAEIPAGPQLRFDHLLELLGQVEGHAVAVLVERSAQLTVGARTQVGAHGRRDLEQVGAGAHRHFGRVQPEGVAQVNLEFTVVTHAHRGAGADPVEAEQRSRFHAAGHRRAGVLATDHAEIQRVAGPLLGPPGPRFLPGFENRPRGVHHVARLGCGGWGTAARSERAKPGEWHRGAGGRGQPDEIASLQPLTRITPTIRHGFFSLCRRRV